MIMFLKCHLSWTVTIINAQLSDILYVFLNFKEPLNIVTSKKLYANVGSGCG